MRNCKFKKKKKTNYLEIKEVFMYDDDEVGKMRKKASLSLARVRFSVAKELKNSNKEDLNLSFFQAQPASTKLLENCSSRKFTHILIYIELLEWLVVDY